jgi:hypothetical protein
MAYHGWGGEALTTSFSAMRTRTGTAPAQTAADTSSIRRRPPADTVATGRVRVDTEAERSPKRRRDGNSLNNLEDTWEIPGIWKISYSRDKRRGWR